jgi:hypothetical protein
MERRRTFVQRFLSRDGRGLSLKLPLKLKLLPIAMRCSQLVFEAAVLGAVLSACGGSGFSVVATTSPEASSTNDSGVVVPDASGGSTSLVDSSAEEQIAPEDSLGTDGASLPEGSGSTADATATDAPTRACPSTCAQLNANCGAVTDTFCGGLVQCGLCTTGVCGGAAPSTCGCPAGQLACGASCTNPMTDSANCGRCGTSCAATAVQGEACVAGACACPAGTQLCAGQQATYCNLVYKSCF